MVKRSKSAQEIKDAKEQYEYAFDRDRTNRDEALEDARFASGEQWPDRIRRQREREGRPALVINETTKFTRTVTGEVRLNPPAMKVVVDEGYLTSPEELQAGKEQAEIREGLLRRIEYRSRGQHQYVAAVDNAAVCGMGHIRIMTEYGENDPFNQDMRFMSVGDALSVLYDPDAIRLTREDGMYAFVTGLMSEDKFKRKYPKAKSTSEWGRYQFEVNNQYWEWGDKIRVAEMFERVTVPRKAMLLSNGRVVDITEDDDSDVREMLALAARQGVREVETKDFEGFKVVRRVMNGMEILEEDADFPSQYIPLIPVWGEERYVGESRVRRGMVRDMRDPQRLQNYWRTAAAEMVGLAPKAPFFVTSQQVEEHRAQWDQANQKPFPYLEYTPDEEAPGPPVRATQPEPPAAMWQEAATAKGDMRDVTGIYDASLGAMSNETSGRAIMARQRQGNVGTYVYIDNLKLAIERLAVTLMDMMPRVYDTQRSMMLTEENGSQRPVIVNHQMPDGSIQNNLKRGTYEIRVTTGPSYLTRQEEEADKTIQLVQAFPQLMAVAGDILVETMDLRRGDEIAERLKQAMQPPQPMPMQPPPPSPKDIADAEKSAAQAESYEADARKKLAEAEGQEIENAWNIQALRTGRPLE